MLNRVVTAVFLVSAAFATSLFADITAPSSGANFTPGTGITVSVSGNEAYGGGTCIIYIYKKDSQGNYTITAASGTIALNGFGAGALTLYPAIGETWPVGTGSLKIEAKVQGNPDLIDYGSVIVNVVN